MAITLSPSSIDVEFGRSGDTTRPVAIRMITTKY